MICALELAYAAGRFHGHGVAEPGQKLEAAMLMQKAAGDLAANPAIIAGLFGVSQEELEAALSIAKSSPEPVSIMLAEVEGVQ